MHTNLYTCCDIYLLDEIQGPTMQEHSLNPFIHVGKRHCSFAYGEGQILMNFRIISLYNSVSLDLFLRRRSDTFTMGI